MASLPCPQQDSWKKRVKPTTTDYREVFWVGWLYCASDFQYPSSRKVTSSHMGVTGGLPKIQGKKTSHPRVPVKKVWKVPHLLLAILVRFVILHLWKTEGLV